MKRKLVTNGPYNSELESNRFYLKINDGNYGDAVKPTSADGKVTKSPSFKNEAQDVASGASTGVRGEYKDIRLKQNGKFSYSVLFNTSGDPHKEWSLGTELELTLGIKEHVLATRGASASIKDPNGVLAGIIMTTKGVLLGFAGNYVTVKVVYGGPTGSPALDVSTSPALVATFYGDTTVEDMLAVINASSILEASTDGVGDDVTDLVIDLAASRTLASGVVIALGGGAEAGFVYSNKEAPYRDACAILAKQKMGQLISGMLYDKISFEFNSGLPEAKVEGSSKKSLEIGYGTIKKAAAASTKLYVTTDIKHFAVDEEVPTFIDVLAADKETYISSFNKIVGIGSDVDGAYVEVLNPVTAPIGAWVCFTEPADFTPMYAPFSGQSGSIKLDGQQVSDIKNIKFEYANNLQELNDLALTSTMGGFAASKLPAGKISFDMIWRRDNQDLINKLRQKEIQTIPVEITVGTVAGKKLKVYLQNVSFNFPDTQSKADELTLMSIEGKIVVSPEHAEFGSVIIATI